jgi:hypothetical protein
MPASKRSPLFVAALVLLALIAVGEAWLITERFTAARVAEKKLVQQRAALAGLAEAAPAPSRETAAQIESDLARARVALAAMQAELRGRGPSAERFKSAKPPAARTDAFFDLATFVEGARSRAKQQGIRIAPAADHFGFSLYANEGPEIALIAPVFHQRLVVQYLVEALLDARPRALLSLQRERPLSEDERKARAEALAAAAQDNGGAASPRVDDFTALSEDYFAPDPRLSASAPGAVEVTAFRLVFTGQTAALRAFLNKLAGFELPVIVRSVEVEPAASEDEITAVAAEENAPPAARATPPASVVLTASAPAKAKPPAVAPLVPKALSRFTVIVEFIDLLPPPAAASNPTVSS